MKRLRLLWNIVRVTSADYVFYGFLAVLAAAAFALPRVEAGIPTFGDALWYLFVSFTTIGFGDFSAVTTAGRLVTVAVSLYGILVVALLTGIIVGFYNELLKVRANTSLNEFVAELEHLPDLSREELLALAEKVRKRHILR
ncbi:MULTISPECIES: potassium channel family protein [Arthrobacter]|uniref:Potassium channel family protein n=1 Tax=Arthrobacter sunyaminii TaxID=2816859 RepID=A0A975PDT8_9MICC|nr:MULTISPECIES: potassium channel family protein [Arthrobacter]MBO0896044.1 two pore domain potassium channel family protein [Arthrobacter sunyaminii]MBO0907719.1 two pore domain potassium channel family protein [Arthrobacter sunyaminii]QWQ35274.1 potassium channel family protein [Arthrobacter sunyaminii]